MSEVPVQRSGLNILVVDDDEDDYLITRQICNRIQEVKINVEWAPGYDPALEQISAGEYDVILIDYRLGASTGIELLREITPHTDVPCILLTGQGGREVDLEAMESGATDYLAKTELTPVVLERTLRYALERKRAEERLNRLALYDTLTGLANRSLFRDRLDRELSRATRFGHSIALMFIDLDGFKTVNDTLGHDVGDELIKVAANRLSACTRQIDTVARLGGDEFVIILAGLEDTHEAIPVAERILVSLSRPFHFGGQDVQVTGSIGITFYPDDSNDADVLIKNADMAMYSAKANGRNGFELYRTEMAIKAARQLDLQRSLRHALDRDEFVLHYQPQIDVTSGKICGVEALLRWQRPSGELIAPGDFMPVLEEMHLINDVGDWVVKDACKQFRSWWAAKVPVPRISVNVSRAQLRRRGFVVTLKECLAETGMDPTCLSLELTESALIADDVLADTMLREITALGATIALDDFGTGYSSLACLRDFPIAALKIDRAFVKGLPDSTADAALATTIVAMAQAMGLRVIAEGVETKEQAEFLAARGCNLQQGFLFSRAVPPDQFVEECKRRGVTDGPV